MDLYTKRLSHIPLAILARVLASSGAITIRSAHFPSCRKAIISVTTVTTYLNMKDDISFLAPFLSRKEAIQSFDDGVSSIWRETLIVENLIDFVNLRATASKYFINKASHVSYL